MKSAAFSGADAGQTARVSISALRMWSKVTPPCYAHLSGLASRASRELSHTSGSFSATPPLRNVRCAWGSLAASPALGGRRPCRAPQCTSHLFAHVKGGCLHVNIVRTCEGGMPA
eukprot:2105123-Pyramimonas_sp.AAC.1